MSEEEMIDALDASEDDENDLEVVIYDRNSKKNNENCLEGRKMD